MTGGNDEDRGLCFLWLPTIIVCYAMGLVDHR